MKDDLVCPCGSGLSYTTCCQPIIDDHRAATTAEQLMRSRYSAYVGKEIAYILKTILPKKRKDIDEEGVRTWSEKTHWQRLEIRRTEKGLPQNPRPGQGRDRSLRSAAPQFLHGHPPLLRKRFFPSRAA
jgi:uncharacterized protein YchJ